MLRTTSTRGLPAAILGIVLSTLVAPSSLAQSVLGSHTEPWNNLWQYKYRTTVTIDTAVIDGVVTGSVVLDTTIHDTQTHRTWREQCVEQVTSLTVLGNQAWIVTSAGDSFHIVDNGRHGDLFDGFPIRGNYTVRE